MVKVDNAVIMAAGTSSRFAPLSYEKPKGLVEVKGEILIERQIRQLREAGIDDIFVVTGYKAKAFQYLENRFGVHLRNNPYYDTRNNNASIKAVEDVLSNTYVCSADNYFTRNPFEPEVDNAFYAAVYSNGPTNEWCMKTDPEGWITSVTVGGSDAWYMLGHTFWDESFSKAFIKILDAVYNQPETADKLWENIYIDHLDQLHMKMRKYPDDFIFEFDTLDELRTFDTSYINDTHSAILKRVAEQLKVKEKDLMHINCLKDTKTTEAIGFTFDACGHHHTYLYDGGLRD
jgi:CTP:phosphocholine cytidylyltransferase-like protein